MTPETIVTAEMTVMEILNAMIRNGATTTVGETYLIDWLEECDPVGVTIGDLVAEWEYQDDDPNDELRLNSYRY